VVDEDMLLRCVGKSCKTVIEWAGVAYNASGVSDEGPLVMVTTLDLGTRSWRRGRKRLMHSTWFATAASCRHRGSNGTMLKPRPDAA